MKTGSSENFIPEDNLTKNKFRKISRVCRLFSGFHKELIDENRGWRMDLIAVTLKKDGGNEISHYENIMAQ